MDFRFDDERQFWCDTVHSFMEKAVGVGYTRRHDEAREFPNEAYEKTADRGWLGLLVPEEYGGLAAAGDRRFHRHAPKSVGDRADLHLS